MFQLGGRSVSAYASLGEPSFQVDEATLLRAQELIVAVAQADPRGGKLGDALRALGDVSALHGPAAGSRGASQLLLAASLFPFDGTEAAHELFVRQTFGKGVSEEVRLSVLDALFAQLQPAGSWRSRAAALRVLRVIAAGTSREEQARATIEGLRKDRVTIIRRLAERAYSELVREPGAPWT